jgi:RimJ/RimL family protein N-acetyltransferase
MQKLGMKKEGEFRRHVLRWGQPQDLVYYGILSTEFRPALPGT